jgi:tripartite-type tricarboxylate transporter receptor subunit TctC
VDLLSREIQAATRTPEIGDRLTNEGVIAIGSSPSEFAAYIRKEHGRIGKVVKTSGAKFE